MTRSRLHHRTILFSWCSPFQNHAILCRKWRMTILVLGFPFRSVCHFCSLWWMHFKELKGCLTGAEASILGWELMTSRRVCFFLNRRKSIRRRCLLFYAATFLCHLVICDGMLHLAICKLWPMVDYRNGHNVLLESIPLQCDLVVPPIKSGRLFLMTLKEWGF